MQQTPQGITFSVKIIPKAACSEFVKWEEDTLKIRIAAAPEKGQANREVIEFLAKELKIAKSAIEIISGHSSRKKRIFISNLEEDIIAALFAHLRDLK